MPIKIKPLAILKLVMKLEVLPLSFARPREVVGGKAFNLYQLISGDFNVPKGFVCMSVSAESMEFVFNQLQAPLIVRSSANMEDSEVLSFAGVLESFSPINTKEELLAHVKKIFALKDSQRVLEYLRHYNIDPSNFSLRVIIQEWKKPIWAGVLFTSKTTDSGKVIVLEASTKDYGVVSGGEAVSRLVLDKTTTEVKSASLKGMPVAVVQKIVEIIPKIEKTFGQPQDIEWVWDGKSIFLVQARPITEKFSSAEAVIQEEIDRLKAIFPAPPVLKQSQFADGMVTATPMTASVFEKIFAREGSLGKVLKKFGLKSILVNGQYLVYVGGRLYLNKGFEDVLTKYFFGKTGLLNPKSFFVQLVLQYRFLFFWRKIQKEANKPFNLDPNLNTTERLRVVMDRLIYTTTPWVLEISMYQQYSKEFLQKKLEQHLSPEDVEKVLNSGVVHEIAIIPGTSPANQEYLLKKFGHRALEEMELANPRFSENPKMLFEMLSRKNAPVWARDDSKKMREEFIDKYQSVMDQQILVSFFNLYDTYTKLRELVHDVWVKDFSRLRSLLLTIDSEQRLYNSIWYAKIEDCMKGEKLNVSTLMQEKSRFQHLKLLNLGPNLELKNWVQLLESRKPTKSEKVYKGIGVSSGVVFGKVGTLEGIAQGKQIDILWNNSLDPNLVFIFGKIKGLIASVGGELSHAAILAREYGIPVVIADLGGNVPVGSEARVDGTLGTVEFLN